MQVPNKIIKTLHGIYLRYRKCYDILTIYHVNIMYTKFIYHVYTMYIPSMRTFRYCFDMPCTYHVYAMYIPCIYQAFTKLYILCICLVFCMYLLYTWQVYSTVPYHKMGSLIVHSNGLSFISVQSQARIWVWLILKFHPPIQLQLLHHHHHASLLKSSIKQVNCVGAWELQLLHNRF